MASANLNGTAVTYKYNADGLRTYKKVGSTVHEYEYLGDKLIYEKRTTSSTGFSIIVCPCAFSLFVNFSKNKLYDISVFVKCKKIAFLHIISLK